MALYFITSNKNKFLEVKDIIPHVEQLLIDLPEIQEIDAKKIIKAKIIEALKHKKGELIIEDTSLYFDCLNGLPGPLIKWFLTSLGNQGLFELANKFENFNAEARTIIGYAKNSNEIFYFQGSLKGKIVYPNAVTDFGWDPIFQPEGYLMSFAEMSKVEKNKISMRSQAASQLKDFLSKNN